MIKVMVYLKRRPDLSHEEFIAYWRDVHAPLAIKAPGFVRHMGRYIQNYPEPDADGEYAYDGIAECWYASEADMKGCTDNDYFREHIRPDEERFLDLSKTFKMVFRENEIFARP